MVIIAAVLIVLIVALVLYIAKGGPKLPPATNAIIEHVLNSDLPEVVRGQTGYAISDGLHIWYESIAPTGSLKGVVLLIMANGGDALIWPPKFVQAFVDAGYQVIRYDHRGVGLSDWVENWDRKHPYLIADMAHDALAVLDTLAIQKAHVIGLSLGGMVSQEVAIQQPDRVASLTLMLTSGFIGDPDLPNVSSSYFLSALVKGLPLMKYRLMGGEKNLILERIAKTISVSGYEGLDIKELAELVLYDLRKRRGIHLKGALQHQAAVSNSGSRYDNLKRLDVPTLVIHGTADPLIPIEHGKKLVELIPNARELWLEGVGHVFPLPNMDAISQRILAQLAEAAIVTAYRTTSEQ